MELTCFQHLPGYYLITMITLEAVLGTAFICIVGGLVYTFWRSIWCAGSEYKRYAAWTYPQTSANDSGEWFMNDRAEWFIKEKGRTTHYRLWSAIAMLSAFVCIGVFQADFCFAVALSTGQRAVMARMTNVFMALSSAKIVFIVSLMASRSNEKSKSAAHWADVIVNRIGTVICVVAIGINLAELLSQIENDQSCFILCAKRVLVGLDAAITIIPLVSWGSYLYVKYKRTSFIRNFVTDKLAHSDHWTHYFLVPVAIALSCAAVVTSSLLTTGPERVERFWNEFTPEQEPERADKLWHAYGFVSALYMIMDTILTIDIDRVLGNDVSQLNQWMDQAIEENKMRMSPGGGTGASDFGAVSRAIAVTSAPSASVFGGGGEGPSGMHSIDPASYQSREPAGETDRPSTRKSLLLLNG